MAFAHRKLLVACVVAGITATGCQSVRVFKNPPEGDTGVRYYRPKPYLLVTAADPTGRLVNLKLEYHPDFSEEYSAHMRGKASLALKDGWNLVGVNTKEAPPKEEAPPAPVAPPALPGAVVAATNVPMGYYESIFEVAGNKKYLKGWRYIGMTILGGGAPATCHLPNCPNKWPDGCVDGPLFGLVSFNGVMTFRQLDEIAGNQTCPAFVDPAPGRTAAAPADAPAPPETPRQGPTIEQGPVERGPATIESVPSTTTPEDAAKKKLQAPPTPNIPQVPSTNPSASRRSAAAVRSLVENLPPLPTGLGR